MPLLQIYFDLYSDVGENKLYLNLVWFGHAYYWPNQWLLIEKETNKQFLQKLYVICLTFAVFNTKPQNTCMQVLFLNMSYTVHLRCSETMSQ